MKKIFILAIAILAIQQTQAQELPVKSSFTKIEQRVGLTDISIEYSRPNTNKRELLGKLIQFDTIWRLGANQCTKITISSDLIFNKGILKKGKYAMFVTPHKNGEWDIHFNTDTTQWGAYDYDKLKDVLVVKSKLKYSSEYIETMTMEFSEVQVSRAIINIKWGKILVPIRIGVPTFQIAKDNIKIAIKKGENLDRVYVNAADFYLEYVKNNKIAMNYANQSIQIKESYHNLYVKAAIFYEMKNLKEANTFIDKAIKKAKADDKPMWINYLTEKADSWNK